MRAVGVIFLLLLSLALADLDVCSMQKWPDPCLPGGTWDPLLKRCLGYKARDCFGCYAGEFCKEVKKDCVLESQGGDPMLFQEFWEEEQGSPCTKVPSNYRTAYQFVDANDPIAPLAAAIREFHDEVGNAVTTGKQLVLCNGATQCNAAAMYAFVASRLNTTSPVQFYAQRPYYAKYPWQASTTLYSADDGREKRSEWNADATPDAPNTVEIVTHPNNPDGRLRWPISKDPSRNATLFDCVYHWPHFTNVSLLNQPVMVFSASKVTGHAGSRMGWAFVEDSGFAGLMREYVKEETLGVSIDTQLRLLDLLQSLRGRSADYFAFTRGHMARQFVRLIGLFNARATERGFVLTNAHEYDHGGYAWIKCPSGYDCYALFSDVGLLGLSGDAYGVSREYLRLCMMMRTVEIEQMLPMIARRIQTEPLPPLVPGGPYDAHRLGPVPDRAPKSIVHLQH